VTPDDEIYLVLLEGQFVLHEALDLGAPRAPTGSWVALIIGRAAPLQVGEYTLRPERGNLNLGTLGPAIPISLDRSGTLRSGYWLCCLLFFGLMSVSSRVARWAVARFARVRAGSDRAGWSSFLGW